jgi:hypothetical protein
MLEQVLMRAAAYLDGAAAATLALNARLLDIEGADNELRAEVLDFMREKLAEARLLQLQRIRTEFEAFERGDEVVTGGSNEASPVIRAANVQLH